MDKNRRSNSPRPDPPEKLLEYVEMNNLQEISNLLCTKDPLLTKEYSNSLSILEMACYQLADVVRADTVRLLIMLGADPTQCIETWESKSAIHFATMGQNPEILEVIASDSKVKINATTQGRNALHILIIYGDPTKNFEECVRILCRHGIDFQRRDYKNNRPIFFAALKKYTNIVEILLSQNNRVTTKEVVLLDILDAQLDYVVDDSEPLNGLDYLNKRDANGFISWYDQQQDIIDNEEKSYLQLACEQNLVTIAKYLIEKNPNKVGSINKMHPLTMVVQNGYFQIVELFLNRLKRSEVPPNLLSEALKRADLDGNRHTIDFQRSCKLILNYGGLDVNERDSGNGHYPLHYAVRYAGKAVVSELLQQKASLANRDRFNYLTIHEIDQDTLKQHYDSCIKAHPADAKDVNREELYLTFDFTTLLPTTIHDETEPEPEHETDLESNVLMSLTVVKETDAVLKMTEDIDQKPLLLHPLIVSFLYAKWHRVRFLFLANLIIYFLFCASLTWFIFSNYNTPDTVPVDLAFTLLLITTLMLSLRETFQIVFMFGWYFKSTDNYVELALLIDIYLLLFSSTTSHQRQPMFAIAVLLTSLVLLFLIGSIPELATYIVMLRTVSYNFVKFFLFNAILILAFAFSFYTLFRKIPDNNDLDEINQPRDMTETCSKCMCEDDNVDSFNSIYLAIFKTLIMLTGEFEAGDLDFNQYPMISHSIFIIFVFLIAIILLNLLNGLAVSDTQEIMHEAKLIALVTRAQYVAHVEAMFFDYVLSSTCTFGLNIISNSVKQAWQRWMLNNICIAQSLDKGCLKALPNQSGRIIWKSSFSTSYTFLFGGDKLPESTVKLAKSIISDRHTFYKMQDSQYQKLYDMIIEIKNALNKADPM